MRTIFHLDLDAFFVSVERILDPSLRGKPVIVGGDPKFGRGVVAACSYEARAYGLHSAMPIRTAYRLCPHGIYIHGSHGEYSRFSRAVKNILLQYAPLVQQASIDEFYMDFTGCRNVYGSLFTFASYLQREIWKKLSLPCSIGIGSNKTIAKIGSDCLKPNGITYILPGMEKEFLAPMPVESIPGVGKVTLKDLHSKGIYKIGDIAELPQDYFAAAYGKYGIDLYRKACGKGGEYLTFIHEQKSISHERTFADVTSKKFLKEKLFKLTGKVCQELRDKNWFTSSVNIKLRYSDFKTLTRSRKIKPTDDDKIIFDAAWNMLMKACTRRVAVRLIGIGLSKFSKFSEQEELFEWEEIKRRKMLRAVTIIRDKYGYESVVFGTAETDKKLQIMVNPFRVNS
ncbi:MAG: DNA polymerase IV [Ignavibacteria bacterium]|nr:DNA polymerase IV [Ignavibacteria bacterium]MBT8383072.1 DNA polymerase IV [Ignavibacteria bacterium]NNL22187.1 DNA polymerase IV [Ignavibacteriaceae bacterium]